MAGLMDFFFPSDSGDENPRPVRGSIPGLLNAQGANGQFLYDTPGGDEVPSKAPFGRPQISDLVKKIKKIKVDAKDEVKEEDRPDKEFAAGTKEDVSSWEGGRSALSNLKTPFYPDTIERGDNQSPLQNLSQMYNYEGGAGKNKSQLRNLSTAYQPDTAQGAYLNPPTKPASTRLTLPTINVKPETSHPDMEFAASSPGAPSDRPDKEFAINTSRGEEYTVDGKPIQNTTQPGTTARSDAAPGRPTNIHEDADAGVQYPSRVAPQGSIIDRLLQNVGNFRDQNKMTLLALAGGLAGSQSWGQGLGRAFTAAVPAQQQDIINNRFNSTVGTFQKQGMPHDAAVAFASNPELTQQALGQAYGVTPPQIHPYTKTDGSQGFIQFNPKTKTWDQLHVGGGTGGGVDRSEMPINYDPKTGRDEGYIAQVKKESPEDYALMMSALQGNISGTQRNMTYAIKMATRAELGFDQHEYKRRADAYQQWYSANGKGEKASGSLNQAAIHAVTTANSIMKLHNYGGALTPLNMPANAIGAAFGKVTTGPLDQDFHALANELSAIWKQGTNSDTEIRHWEKNFPVNGSIQQQKAALAEAMTLMEGGLQRLEEQRRKELGPIADTLPPVANQRTLEQIAKLKAWANDTTGNVPPPSNSETPGHVPIITATNPRNGNKAFSDDGGITWKDMESKQVIYINK
jgi:hypothetical protein